MYNAFHHTGQWPDGGSYLEQPALVIEMFQIIESQVRKIEERERRDSGL